MSFDPIAMTRLAVTIGYDNDDIVNMLMEVYGLADHVARDLLATVTARMLIQDALSDVRVIDCPHCHGIGETLEGACATCSASGLSTQSDA